MIICFPYTPHDKDIVRYEHYKTATKCWQTECGTYEILLVVLAGGWKHLKVHRRDDKPIHNYMDMQEIKNQCLGKDAVAIEIYPKAGDFKDGSHTYHLWSNSGPWATNLPNLANIPKFY